MDPDNAKKEIAFAKANTSPPESYILYSSEAEPGHSRSEADEMNRHKKEKKQTKLKEDKTTMQPVAKMQRCKRRQTKKDRKKNTHPAVKSPTKTERFLQH